MNQFQVVERQKAAPTGSSRIWTLFGKVFGFDLERSAYYPMKIPVVIVLALVAAGGVVHLVSTVLGPTVRLAVPLVWLFMSRKAFASFEAKRAGKLYSQFPDALAMIVRSVRVGIPVSETVRAVAKEAMEPTATEFMILSDQLAIGVTLENALRECAARNRLPEYRFFATALALQAQTGGGLSETLENLSDVIRKRVAARQRAFALAAEARTSTYVLAALPFFTGAALGVMNPEYIGVLFTEEKGHQVLALALTLLSLGMYVMKAAINKSLK